MGLQRIDAVETKLNAARMICMHSQPQPAPNYRVVSVELDRIAIRRRVQDSVLALDERQRHKDLLDNYPWTKLPRHSAPLIIVGGLRPEMRRETAPHQKHDRETWSNFPTRSNECTDHCDRCADQRCSENAFYTTGDVTGMAAGIIVRTYLKTPICWCSGVRCRDLSPSRYPTVEFIKTTSGNRNQKEEAIR